jgi:hypothetical protein
MRSFLSHLKRHALEVGEAHVDRQFKWFGGVMTMRAMFRVIALILVSVIGLGVGLKPVVSAPAPAAAPQTDLKGAAVVLGVFDALNRGDASAAASAFADKGFLIGAALVGLCSLTAPCYDREKIRANFEVLVKLPHSCDTVTSLQVSGSVVLGRLEARGDGLRARGIERVVQLFMAQVLQDKVVAYFGRNDLADPETARNVAIVAGTEPKGTPIAIAPPCG